MISYFSNRHYQKLTHLLPEELRGIQPTTIYYKSFEDHQTLQLLQENKQLTYRTIGRQSKQANLTRDGSFCRPIHAKKKLTIKKRKAINIETNKVNACPLCFEQHIAVSYYGFKHICLKCRNFVRDGHGNQIKIFVKENEESKEKQIVCLGIIPKQVKLKGENEKFQYRYYVTDHTKLQVLNMSVYATFAQDDELVLIIRDHNEALARSVWSHH